MKLPSILPEAFPEYLRRTWESRKNPKDSLAWAKSVMVFAIPFASLRSNGEFLPRAKRESDIGYIAGYSAGKIDYHAHAERFLAHFTGKLKDISCRDFRCEPFCDTRPFAEKVLALAGGLGVRGLNSCVLVSGHGSGCLLCGIATEAELSTLRIGGTDKKANPCHDCGRCLKQCPTGAVAPGRYGFRIELCRSHLSMEKKGEFNDLESRLIGDWIFGCDICSSSCPDSSMPPPFPADISWILEADESEIKSLIKGTALEYAGAKRLKRNAVAVKRNRVFPHE